MPQGLLLGALLYAQLTNVAFTHTYIIDDALLQQAEINRVNAASELNFQSLVEWLNQPQGGNMFLRGRETYPWRSENFADLVCLRILVGQICSLACGEMVSYLRTIAALDID